VPGADHQHAATVRREHRLLGVDDQVQQHLLQLIAIGEHPRQGGGERVDDGDVRDAPIRQSPRQRLSHHLVDINHRPCRLTLAREGQEIADDASGTLRFAENGFKTAAYGIVHRGVLRESFRPAQDGGERVVELVSDA
jgi:hypothetical protein